MSQGSRPDRVGDQIRAELSTLLARTVRDPGIGFITLTTVRVTTDLQLARVYYTVLGDGRARRDTGRALVRATPFLRRQVAARLGLRRAPELVFQYDESLDRQERVEQLLRELHADAEAAEPPADDEPHD